VKVVILGCGRVGSTIASTMSRDGHDVTIIDMNPDSFRRLSKKYAGKMLIGNGMEEDTLSKAGLGNADAFMAVTNGDNRNIMSAQLAKVRFKVPKVVARIYDPIRAAAYAEMGVDTVCTTCIGAGVIRDMIQNKPFASVEDYCRVGLEDAAMEVAHE